MAVKTLFSFEVQPGMVVASDLYNLAGQLVLPAGFVLDEATIAKLEYYTILEVPIDDSPKQPVSQEPVAQVADTATHSETVKRSADFFEFKTHYDAAINRIAGTLPQIVRTGGGVNTEILFTGIQSLLSTTKNTIHIFDMIHNLRNQDDVTASHSVNVALISNILGKWLGYNEEDLKILTLAGLLHDIGKYTIPANILNKPGRLTDEEFALIKEHPKRGYEILRSFPIDIRIKEACLLHHERCDGTGYPFKTVSDRIPSVAKIVAIADVYDAMTASRSYRGAICPFEVIRMFDEEGLKRYDPHYIMTFLNHISETYLHTNVRLSNGSVGEIVMINQLCLYRPVVRVGTEFIDLMKETQLKIESLV